MFDSCRSFSGVCVCVCFFAFFFPGMVVSSIITLSLYTWISGANHLHNILKMNQIFVVHLHSNFLTILVVTSTIFHPKQFSRGFPVVSLV